MSERLELAEQFTEGCFFFFFGGGGGGCVVFYSLRVEERTPGFGRLWRS